MPAFGKAVAVTVPTWQRSSAEIGGRLLSWRRAGPSRARPLLYLHDAGADTVTAPALDVLAADFDVVVLDLPGYAESGPPVGLHGVADVTDMLAGLLNHLAVGPAIVAGTSLGGWFAAELALAFPDRVAALFLSDAAGLHAPEEYLFALFSQGRAAAATETLIADSLLVRLPRAEQDVEGEPAAVAAAITAPWVSNLAAAAAMSWHPYTVNPRLLGRLGDISCPTTVLWGERDALIPLEHGRILARRIPGARLIVLPGVGHLPAVEAPDAFAEAVRALAADLPGRAGTFPN